MQLEQARGAVDQAKLNFELAKDDLEQCRQAYDQVVAKADEFDVPRAKFKKLAEERSAALLMSGILSAPANAVRAAKAPKTPKKSKETPPSETVLELVEDSVEAAVN